jgi:hypothetical protein
VVFVACVFLSLVLLEVCLTIYDWSTAGRLYRTANRQPGATPVAEDRKRDTVQKIQPYFGQVLRPGWRPTDDGTFEEIGKALQLDTPPDWWSFTANNYGFISPYDYPVHPKEKNAYIIGVFGGSVARAFTLQARAQFTDMIRATLNLGDRPIYMLQLASAGFKQPQQVLTLSYFMTVGQHFDLILNLDGFNEAWVSYYNLSSTHTAAEMPFNGFYYGLLNRFLKSEDFVPETFADQLGRLSEKIPLTTLHYVAMALRQQQRQRDFQREDDFGKPLPGVLYPSLLEKDNATYEARIDHVVDTWYRGSLAMQALASSIGARYIHVLQPNQYYSKKNFSEEERKIAFGPNTFPMGTIVPLFYDKARKLGPTLNAAGVQFMDASATFDNVTARTYSDSCCHYVQRGYEILVPAIIDWMSKTSSIPARP